MVPNSEELGELVIGVVVRHVLRATYNSCEACKRGTKRKNH